MILPFHSCPRFEDCNVNLCPLDPDKSNKALLPEESKCSLRKSIRLRLGKNLPNLGLHPREFNARKRWVQLGQIEKEQRITQLKENLSKKPKLEDQKASITTV